MNNNLNTGLKKITLVIFFYFISIHAVVAQKVDESFMIGRWKKLPNQSHVFLEFNKDRTIQLYSDSVSNNANLKGKFIYKIEENDSVSKLILYKIEYDMKVDSFISNIRSIDSRAFIIYPLKSTKSFFKVETKFLKIKRN